MTSNFVIGISGGSASGKTEFYKRILDSYCSENICLISQDNYYRHSAEQYIDENGYVNFDLPDSINVRQFADHLKKLKYNKKVTYQEYDFVEEKPKVEFIELLPAPIIIVEGIFVFHYPDISDHLDLKLYVEADSDLMLKRRLERDQKERGYEYDEIMYRFENHVLPAYNQFILPYKNSADLIVPNFKSFNQALEVISAFIDKRIKINS